MYHIGTHVLSSPAVHHHAMKVHTGMSVYPCVVNTKILKWIKFVCGAAKFAVMLVIFIIIIYYYAHSHVIVYGYVIILCS